MSTIWLDTWAFQEHGGWRLDTQFTHLTGASCLVAAGAGEPVADAEHRFGVSEAGTYRLWVYSRNWLSEHSPGRFRVRIHADRDATPLNDDRVFGAQDAKGWSWEDGGSVQLAEGYHYVSLRDATGYYGRCGVLLLTTDLDYVPPTGAGAVLAERRRITGQPEKAVGEDYDLVVAGAGIAGVCAAVAAARHGLRTALLSDRPLVGGNASDELGVGVNGAGVHRTNARELGIVSEIVEEHARHGCRGWTAACLHVIEPEEHLDVVCHCRVTGVRMADEKTVEAVETLDPRDGTPGLFRAPLFVDATGDGWIGFYAGAEYRVGREARREHGERRAPEEADGITLSGCLMNGRHGAGFRAEETVEDQPFVAPPWAPVFDERHLHDREIVIDNGTWWHEHHGEVDDLAHPEEARDELIRISLGYWDYVKNRWSERERARRHRLVDVPILNARREGRRLLGDHILTYHEVMQPTRFPDRVAYGGWGVDIHNPAGIYAEHEGPWAFNDCPAIYTLPYRCLYSRNIDNLLLAGRAISVTHVALGTVRIQATLGLIGQVAGTAAALCASHDCLPRGIYEEHVQELQQTLLRDGQTIPDVTNEDPEDLARRATATASSVQPHGRSGRDTIRTSRVLPVRMEGITWVVPLDRVGGRLEAFQTIVIARQPCEVHLTVRAANADGEPEGPVLVEHRERFETAGEYWIRFPLDLAPGSGHVAVRLHANDALRVYMNDLEAPGVRGGWLTCVTEPEATFPADYSAANVLNGITRPVGDAPNLWMSDRSQFLPQDLVLTWDEPQTFHHVQIVFDTDCTQPRMGDMNHPGTSPFCVRDYELAVLQGGKWHTVIVVAGNVDRLCRHDIEPTTADALRLRVFATHGDPAARVFEVRVYGETDE